MNFYLIRHGESESREGMNHEKASNVSLSEKGRKEVFLLSKKIKKIKPDKIFCSPIKRTKETADILFPDSEKIFEDRIKEQIISRDKVGKDFKNLKKQGRMDFDFSSEDGESFNQTAERFISFLNEKKKNSNENYFVISHALIMQASLTKMFNLEEIPNIETASISLITWDGSVFKISYLNRSYSNLKNLKNFLKKILQ